MAGGELGRTLGPIIVAWAVSTWTLEGYYRVIFIGWIATAVLFWRLREIIIPKQEHEPVSTLIPAFRRLYLPLAGIILFQSFLSISITIYLPTYITSRGSSLLVAGSSLAVLELAGVIGALTSGTISDRLGRKPILFAAILVSSLLTFLVRFVSGFAMIPLLVALGFFALSIGPIYLAMVQDYLNSNKALGNGIFMSMNFLLRSLVIVLVGMIGDTFGIQNIYLAGGALSLIALPIILTLPGKRDYAA
jgi:FSR family fosmidomycin resistance protein-like MFS transporter